MCTQDVNPLHRNNISTQNRCSILQEQEDSPTEYSLELIKLIKQQEKQLEENEKGRYHVNHINIAILDKLVKSYKLNIEAPEEDSKELREIDNVEDGILGIILGESELEGMEIAEVSELAMDELEDEIKGLQL